MATTEIRLEDILAQQPPQALHCVSLVKTDGQKINHIECTGEEVDEFLVVTLREEGAEPRVLSRIPLESVASWRNREDYVPQGWRWYGS